MAQIVLLPHYPTTSATPGLNPVTTLPDQWRPTLQGLQPRSFPTPFAIAETTAFHLEHPSPEGASGYQNAFTMLVLGVVLGHLRLELWDLVRDGGSLGAALATIEPEARYLGVLVDARNANALYGAADKHALFWPGARVNQAQWQVLQQQINGDRNVGRAFELLADFRELLRASKLWDPGAIPWMRGLEGVIGQNQPSPGHRTLHEDSQFVGPLRLATPGDAHDVRDRATRVYLPIFRPGYAKAVREMCALSFRSVPERNLVAAVDASGRDLFQIHMPDASTGADMLFLGAGTIRRTDNVATALAPGKIDLQKPDGLLTMMSPILQSLAAVDGAAPSNERIQALPIFYPDVLRIPARLVRPSTVSYSPAVERLVQHGVSIPDAETLRDGGFALPVGATGKQAIYIERAGEHDVGDLRSIGYVLWLYYVGEAEVAGDQPPIRASIDLSALTEAHEERPIAPVTAMTEAVTDERLERDTRVRLAQRLATLQRFARSYRQLDASVPGNVLARRSAEALYRWVLEAPAGEAAPAVGTAASKPTLLPAGGDMKLPLFRDPYVEVS